MLRAVGSLAAESATSSLERRVGLTEIGASHEADLAREKASLSPCLITYRSNAQRCAHVRIRIDVIWSISITYFKRTVASGCKKAANQKKKRYNDSGSLEYFAMRNLIAKVKNQGSHIGLSCGRRSWDLAVSARNTTPTPLLQPICIEVGI